jgi:hypothetical protein
MGKQLLAKALIVTLKELTELAVSELTTTTIDETALAILKRHGSCGITILRLQKKFIFYSLVLLILAALTDRRLQTGSRGLPNCRITPRYLESLPCIRVCISSQSLERYLKPQAMMVL